LATRLYLTAQRREGAVWHDPISEERDMVWGPGHSRIRRPLTTRAAHPVPPSHIFFRQSIAL
jgi:hypothetical protein